MSVLTEQEVLAAETQLVQACLDCATQLLIVARWPAAGGMAELMQAQDHLTTALMAADRLTRDDGPAS